MTAEHTHPSGAESAGTSSCGCGGNHKLSDACRARIVALRKDYPQSRAALLPALHLAQAEYGYLPRPIVDEIAELLDLLPIQVQEVVSFYPMFQNSKVGRCHIQVCANIACALGGARKLVRQIESKLGIRPGEVTPDGRFSLAEVECLGSCGTAPVIQLNNQPFIERVTWNSLHLRSKIVHHSFLSQISADMKNACLFEHTFRFDHLQTVLDSLPLQRRNNIYPG